MDLASAVEKRLVMLALAVAVGVGIAAAIAMHNRKVNSYDKRPDPPGVCSCAIFRGGEHYETDGKTDEERAEEGEEPALLALVAQLASRGVSVLGPPQSSPRFDGREVLARSGEHTIRITLAAYTDLGGPRWFLSVDNEQHGPPPAEALPPIVDALAALDRLTDVTWVARQHADEHWLPDARVVRR